MYAMLMLVKRHSHDEHVMLQQMVKFVNIKLIYWSWSRVLSIRLTSY